MIVKKKKQRSVGQIKMQKGSSDLGVREVGGCDNGPRLVKDGCHIDTVAGDVCSSTVVTINVRRSTSKKTTL